MICSACGLEIQAGEPMDYRGEHCTHRADTFRCVHLLRSNIEALQAKVEALQNVACAYCGHKTLQDGVSPEEVREAVAEHILTCEKRPEAKLIKMLLAQAQALEDAEATLAALLSPEGLIAGTLNIVRAAVTEAKEIAAAGAQ